MKALMVVSLLALLALAPAAVSASVNAHDGGFFLRLSAGGGSGTSSIEMLGSDFEISGIGADLNIAIGGIVSENLAVHGSIFGWSVTDPDVEWQGNSGTADGDFTFTGLGGGITYYAMPSNIYFSASAGVGTLSFEGADSDRGLAAEACVGKEWWVSDNWGLGVAAGVNYHSIGEAGIDESWSGLGFGIRFSATYN